MSIIILIIFVLVGFFGIAEADDSDCAGDGKGCASPAAVATAWMPVTVDDIDGVIVTEEDGAHFIGAEAFWTPATTDVAAAEAAIAAEQGILNHQRQYVGFVEDGDHKVLVNGFCDAFGLDWMSQPVLVEDGGECYFEAVYNAASGVLERFQFNGEA
jgi:hypothetical protein